MKNIGPTILHVQTFSHAFAASNVAGFPGVRSPALNQKSGDPTMFNAKSVFFATPSVAGNLIGASGLNGALLWMLWMPWEPDPTSMKLVSAS